MDILRSVLFDECRTWVICASYALLNALGDSCLDALDVENSTGVSFGIASYGTLYGCTRVLTPATTFWDGTASLEKIMGIHLEEYSFQDKREMLDFFRRTPVSGALLGPLNMTGLSYLPLSTQYKFADHYIAVKKGDSGEFILTDSEGVPGMRVSEDGLLRFLDISGIPEARGRFHIGMASIVREPLLREERTRAILRLAGKNYALAERAGQGGHAFLQCRTVMDTLPPSHWMEPVLYAMEYLIQRKLMLLAADRDGVLMGFDCVRHVTTQIDTLGTMRTLLMARRFPDVRELLPVAAEAETLLTRKLKEWIVL